MAWLHSDEFRRDAVRIVLTSDLTRRQVASDLGIRLSTLDTWVRAISDEVKVPERDADLLRENEQLRKENRVLKEEREVLKTVPGGSPPCARYQQPVPCSARRAVADGLHKTFYNRWKVSGARSPPSV